MEYIWRMWSIGGTESTAIPAKWTAARCLVVLRIFATRRRVWTDAVATNVLDVEKEGGLATVGERGSCQRRDSGPSSEKPRARQGHAHARGACIVRGCVACLQLSSLFIAIGFSLQLVASSHDVVWRGAHSGPTTDLAVRAEWTEQCGGSAVFAVTGGRYSWASGHASIGVLFGADGESRAVETELYRRKDADRRREVAGGALNGRDDTAAGRARRLSTKWRAPAADVARVVTLKLLPTICCSWFGHESLVEARKGLR